MSDVLVEALKARAKAIEADNISTNLWYHRAAKDAAPEALDWIAEAVEVMKIRHKELSEHKKRIESYWSLNEFAVWRDELARLESLLARVKEGV